MPLILIINQAYWQKNMSHNWQEKVKIFEYWLRDLLTKGLFLENCRQFPTFHNGSHSEKIHRKKTSLDLKPCVVFSSKMFLGKEKSYVIDYKTHQVKNACVNFNLWPLLFYFFYDKNAQSSENAKLRKNTIWIQMFFKKNYCTTTHESALSQTRWGSLTF